MQGTYLGVTFIDVGFGDSILVEARKDQADRVFALVDCNDSANYPSSRTFLKRRFERLGLHPFPYPMFKHVFTTHAHADHIQGVQGILKTFGAENLYSSRCDTQNNKNQAFANLIRWAGTATHNQQPVIQKQAYLSQGQTVRLGPVRIDVLWPPSLNNSFWDANEENNNSLVLALTLDRVRFVLCGDCLALNWDTNRLDHVQLPPTDVWLVQVPHHGAYNGLFDGSGTTPMLAQIAKVAPTSYLALSCHPRPHAHPDTAVIQKLDAQTLEYRRTDEHYHVSFQTDGTTMTVCYSHV